MNVLDFVKKVWNSFTSKIQEAGKALGLVGAVAAASLTGTSAHAAALLTAPTLNTDDSVLVAGAVLGGLAIIWGIRAAIRLVR